MTLPGELLSARRMYEIWLVQELADKNTLSDALREGWFDQRDSKGRNYVSGRCCWLLPA